MIPQMVFVSSSPKNRTRSCRVVRRFRLPRLLQSTRPARRAHTPRPGRIAHRGRCQSAAVVVVLFAALTLFQGCADEGSGSENAEPTIRVAEQHGLAYAPLAVVQERDLLESVEWIRLNNAAAIREAMLANRLDVGFMGIPPYLIGRDRGTDWSHFTGLAQAPLGLVTVREDIPSLTALVKGPSSWRIALPQPGSIQHILLSMALDRDYGEATLLDQRLVSMGHPDGMNALFAGKRGQGDVVAHFSSPPYYFEEAAHPDARVLLDGQTAFDGPFTFIIGVLRPGLPADDPGVKRFVAALSAAISEVSILQDELRQKDAYSAISDEAAATLELLSAFYEIEPQRLASYMKYDRLVFETETRGIDTFRTRMEEYGYLTTETE